LGRIKKGTYIRITNSLKVGILRAKWLTKLEDKENLGILTRFKERYTKGYNNAVMVTYFLKDKLYIVMNYTIGGIDSDTTISRKIFIYS